MYNPEATYRVQLHKDFTFAHLRNIIPYLHQLGIKTIYAAPVFTAVPGSMHGYDGINPQEINPEIGTLDELKAIARELKERGMGWLQDFVPNHMAFTPRNPWLCDFMEKGKMSFYDNYFDKNPDEPLMAPFLGKEPEAVIRDGELTLVYNSGKLCLRYFDTEYPLNYTAYDDVLRHELFSTLPLSGVKAELDLLSQSTQKEEFHDRWKKMLDSLSTVLANEEVLHAFQERLEEINGDVLLLERLVGLQFYRLCFWKETDTKINYRRFFTINGLICMNMQRPEVFADYHRLLLQLIKEDLIQGVRIDHVDGLYDPAAYLEQLRREAGPEVYIVVEKILEDGESLPAQWPVQGSTGYEFLAQVNQVLTAADAEQAFTACYRKMNPADEPPQQQVYRYKRMILDMHMQGELHNLLQTFKAIPGLDRPQQIGDEAWKKLIAAILICCPVYRFYPGQLPLPGSEATAFLALLETVQEQEKVPTDVLLFFRDCFGDKALSANDAYKKALLHFWRRCMQLSGPLMAKGVEDTFFYNYPRFLAHNEVGDSPLSFGLPVVWFHGLMQARQHTFPLAMNATATHDTKRGEDTRARLRTLAGDPGQWLEKAKTWVEEEGQDKPGLSWKDRYFVLQVVYGALPFDAADPGFAARLEAYLQKAAREAKTHSGWDAPDEAYEAALTDYALSLADPGNKAGRSLRQYLSEQREAIISNSLAQLVLKCTCPGTPDIYQGTECWDESLVDPDNRRPVDYAARKALLEKISAVDFDYRILIRDGSGPALKLYTLYRLLQLRRQDADVFAYGSYEPVDVGDRYLSFIRRYRGQVIWVVIPLSKALSESKGWQTAFAGLPAYLPDRWEHVFTGEIWDMETLQETALPGQYPVLVLRSVMPDRVSSAGILMPVFSLPSRYGIGDMGKEARHFIGFLSESGQKVWQLLPMNPLLESNFFSPYASVSAFAGEPLYIDPEQLVSEGLLTEAELQDAALPSTATVAYVQARLHKQALLRKAWSRFVTGDFPVLKKDFEVFRIAEKSWLDDYTLFVVLSRMHAEAPWYEWPEAYRDRHPEAMARLRSQMEEPVAFEQWLQFLFHRQWQDLKAFAAQRDIRMIGDLPFYMSHNSADVWSAPSLFSMDEQGRLRSVAGVPPDYFSATGQLWGMPTYDWRAMKQAAYAWWLRRLEKNTAMYDLVRLDHFRAFYDYWEIPAGAATAIEGVWKKGPQDDLFVLLQQHFPSMPFIAEDLGEIHKGVFDFRNKYQLPGMRVLQFGFDNYQAASRDLPHNFRTGSVVYTGTHDNNTTKGWFYSLSKKDKAALSAYVGYRVTSSNVSDTMCRMAYASVAEMAVIPLQDVLHLDAGSRINTPSTTEDNWKWRLLPGKLRTDIVARLLALAKTFYR